MSAPDPVVQVLREWLAKAENDLLTAVHMLGLKEACPTDTVCFHAQQCVEKYIKALLVYRGIPFPKIHDIYELRALLPPRFRPKLDRKAQDRLTEFATVTRYPNPDPVISLAEARKYIAIARRVRKEVRQHLPRAALRRKTN